MDKDKIIDGLRMTMDLCVFDPSTGEEIEPHLLNDISRATYDACKGALEILERLDADSDTISRRTAISAICNACGKIDCDKMDKCEKLQLSPANNSETPNSSDTISRAKAIEICDHAIDLLKGQFGAGALVAIKESIEELPPAQLGTNLAEVGTDCISRQALLDKFEPWLKVKDYNDGELNMLKAVLYEIRFMPPAQPEPSQVAADIARIVENGKDMRVIEAAQPTPDQNGDLWITVPDIDKVTCIYVQESKSKFCRIFYEER